MLLITMPMLLLLFAAPFIIIAQKSRGAEVRDARAMRAPDYFRHAAAVILSADICRHSLHAVVSPFFFLIYVMPLITLPSWSSRISHPTFLFFVAAAYGAFRATRRERPTTCAIIRYALRVLLMMVATILPDNTFSLPMNNNAIFAFIIAYATPLNMVIILMFFAAAITL